MVALPIFLASDEFELAEFVKVLIYDVRFKDVGAYKLVLRQLNQRGTVTDV